MNSLQRSGPGLWFSSCGRFSVRRLPRGFWAVSSVGSINRVGGFTAKLARKIAAQRFTSLADAREAVALLLELEAPSASGPQLQFVRDQQGWVCRDSSGLDIYVSPEGGFWKIHALPASLRAVDSTNLMGEFVADRARCFLGRSRTLAGAKQIARQELSLPMPDLSPGFA